ncbi:MAG: hypothetical protein AB4352_02950 [Hormoscilla sp.]
MKLMAERVESLKAGMLAAGVGAIAFLFTTSMNRWVLPAEVDLMYDVSWLVSGAIAIFSGFLFGVTYRYVIRTDENSHLKSGAILAFGLVRGLAQVDVQLQNLATFWSCGILGLESIFLFAIAGITLDWAIRRRWVKPFLNS